MAIRLPAHSDARPMADEARIAISSPEGIDQIMWVMRPSKLTGVAASSSARRSTATTDLEPDRPL